MKNIQINQVCKSFGDIHAVNNVSLTFEEGKIYGLLGRNGAGKTTLLNLLTNRLFADSGLITVDGDDVTRENAALSKLYFMGEKTYYPSGMRVKEAFKWSKEFYPSFDMDYALKLAEDFELNLRTKVSKLSTGYTSIFKIIIALSVNVEFVVLDEPILGLDAYHRDLFYKTLLETYAQRPRAFVISTHLIEEVSNIIEHVMIMDHGRMIKDTSCEALLSSGYTATGTATVVDAFATGKNVIGYDQVGNIKSAYILHDGEIPSNEDGIEISKMDLQKLFIQLTRTGGQS